MIRFVVFRQRQKTAGYSKFEFGVTVLLLGILFAILLQRMTFYQGQAEHVAVLGTVANIRTGLYLRVAQLHVTNKEADIASLAGQNPIVWLARKPPNYAGEYFAPAPGLVAPGNWYFDRTTKVLVYLFTESKTFRHVASERICFKVELDHLSAITVKPPAAPEKHDGVALIQVTDALSLGCKN